MRRALLLFFFLVSVQALFANSRSQHPIELQVSAGIPYGTGLSVGYHISEIFYFGYTAGGLKPKLNPVEVDTFYAGVPVRAKFTGDIRLFTDIFTFRLFVSPNSGFYVEYNLLLKHWIFETKVLLTAPIFNYDNHLIGTSKFLWSGPSHSAALGWNWVSDSGFSAGIGVGAFAIGKAKYETSQDDVLYLVTDLEKDAEKVADILAENYPVLPLIRVSIGFNF